jgi:hypothetical protein
MWEVYYKPDDDSQEWRILDSYENKAMALFNASRVLSIYFMVKVTDPEDSVIWSN